MLANILPDYLFEMLPSIDIRLTVCSFLGTSSSPFKRWLWETVGRLGEERQEIAGEPVVSLFYKQPSFCCREIWEKVFQSIQRDFPLINPLYIYWDIPISASGSCIYPKLALRIPYLTPLLKVGSQKLDGSRFCGDWQWQWNALFSSLLELH